MLCARCREWRLGRCAAAPQGVSRRGQGRLGAARIAAFGRGDQGGAGRRRRPVLLYERQARPLSRARRASGARGHDCLVPRLHAPCDLGGAVGFHDSVPGTRHRGLGRFCGKPRGPALSASGDAARWRRRRKAAAARGALYVGSSAPEIPEELMARDGYRIFDSDTHVGPDAAILESYLSAADKERLARWAPYRATGRSGRVTYTKGERHYRRKLGTAAPETASAGYMAGFTGVARERQPSPHRSEER